MTIAVNSHNTVRVTDIKQAFSSAALDSITTVTARLLDSQGVEVAQSITLAAVGNAYIGTFSPIGNLDWRKPYILEATVTGVIDGQSRQRTLRINTYSE